MSQCTGDFDAGGQADQVIRVGQREGLVEIVDAPTQSPLGIAPGPVTVHVEIANAEYLRGVGPVSAYFRPHLCPAVVTAPEELERVFPHLGVFVAKMAADNRSASAHPGFVASGCGVNVHCLSLDIRCFVPKSGPDARAEAG